MENAGVQRVLTGKSRLPAAAAEFVRAVVVCGGAWFLCGCAGSSPWASTSQNPVPGPTSLAGTPALPSAQAQSFAGQPAPRLNQLNSGQLGTMPNQIRQPASPNFAQANSSPSIGAQLMSAVRGTSSAVGNTLRIEPKVVPAYDATSLNTQPKQVGSDLHYHAARVYESQNNLDAAALHYGKALAVEPADTKVF